MYSAIGVEPTKLIACTSGLSSKASTVVLSPWTTLNTPSGKPACFNNFACSKDADGSRSDGFKMNVLPHASATGNIHIGTITGKLKGVMPATTPSGWRMRPRIDAARDLVGEFAFQQMRNADREFDHFDAARDFTLCIAERFTVFAREHRCEFVGVFLAQLQVLEQHARPRQRRRVRPGRERGQCGGDGSIDFFGRAQRDLRAGLCPAPD